MLQHLNARAVMQAWAVRVRQTAPAPQRLARSAHGRAALGTSRTEW